MAIQTPKTISRLFTRQDRRLSSLESEPPPRQHVYEPHPTANVVATSPFGGGTALVPLLLANPMALRRVTVIVDDQIAGGIVRAAIYWVDTDLELEPNDIDAIYRERIKFQRLSLSPDLYTTLGILNPAKVHFDFEKTLLDPHRRHWFVGIDVGAVNGNGLYGTHNTLGGATDIPSHFVRAGESGLPDTIVASSPSICNPVYIMARSVVGLRLVRYS